MRFTLQIAEPNEFYPKFKCNIEKKEADIVLSADEEIELLDDQILLEPTQAVPFDGKEHQLVYEGPEGGWVTVVLLHEPVPINAVLDADITEGTFPLTVNFSGSQSTGEGALTYAWDMGDGNTETSESFQHVFTARGVYEVRLDVTDAMSETDFDTETISVFNPVSAVIDTADFGGFAPYTANFDASQSGGETPLSFMWEFGDGFGDAGVTASYTFTTEGTYLVTLLVTDDRGATATDTVEVNVQLATPVEAVLNSDVLSGFIPLTVNFDGVGSTGEGALTYDWDFGDGTMFTGDIDETYEFQNGGTYTVTLTVTDSLGATDSATVSIEAVVPAPIEAHIDAPQTTNYVNNFFYMDGTGSSGEGTLTYAWDFDDGETSTDSVVDHRYSVPGTYTVTLTVTDSLNQTDSTTVELEVVQPAAVVANFTAAPTSGLTPLVVDFDASSSAGEGTLTYAWNFGDGNTGTGVSPQHAYTVAGEYTVTLTVTDSLSATDTATETIEAVAPAAILASFIAEPVSGFLPLTVDFDSSASTGEGALTFDWDFGDGNTHTGANPQHEYLAEGTHTVTLTVTDSVGQTDSDTTAIEAIQPAPAVASFVAEPTSGFNPLTVDFDSSGSSGEGALSYAWDFGDGASSTDANPQHTYTSAGNIDATLTVTDSLNQTDSDTHSIEVIQPTPALAAFTSTPTSGIFPLEVNFDSSGSDGEGALAYAWDFGDGNNSTDANPQHTYTSDGNYTVSLTVTDSLGDSDNATDSIEVFEPVEAVIETEPPVGMTVDFDATSSFGGIGILSAHWDFGDGNTSTDMVTSHTYASSGSFVVTLTVTDTDNNTDSVNTIITLESGDPLAPLTLFLAVQDYPTTPERKVIQLDENLDIVKEMHLDTNITTPEEAATSGLIFSKMHEETATVIPHLAVGAILGLQEAESDPSNPDMHPALIVMDKGVFAPPTLFLSRYAAIQAMTPDREFVYLSDSAYDDVLDEDKEHVIAVNVYDPGYFVSKEIPEDGNFVSAGGVLTRTVSGVTYAVLYYSWYPPYGPAHTLFAAIESPETTVIEVSEYSDYERVVVHGHREDHLIHLFLIGSEYDSGLGETVYTDSVLEYDYTSPATAPVVSDFPLEVNSDVLAAMIADNIGAGSIGRSFYYTADGGIIGTERTYQHSDPQAITKRAPLTYAVEWSVSTVDLGIVTDSLTGISDLVLTEDSVYVVFGEARGGTYRQNDVTVVHLSLVDGTEINRAVFPATQPPLPEAEIIPDVSNPVVGFPAAFYSNNLSGLPMTSWYWSVGSSNYYTENISHTFATTGTHTVSLTIYDQFGQSDNTTLDVIVVEPDPAS